MKLTPKQLQVLTVLFEAGRPMTGSNLAFACGYQGKGRSGAGRAPQWTGRMMLNMPTGLVKRRTLLRTSRITVFELTDKGRRLIIEVKK